MGSHEKYGRRVLKAAAGAAFSEWGVSVQVDYGAGQPARIDGTVGGSIAVEVESRTSKQVRGAVLDLIFHGYQKKLLVLLPVHMSDAQVAAQQCRNALGRFVQPDNFRVVVLTGHADLPLVERDAEVLRTALAELGFSGAV